MLRPVRRRRDWSRALGLAVAATALLLLAVTVGAAPDPPLVVAARQHDPAALRHLLSRSAAVDTPAADGTTALHWAAHWDDTASADLLLRAGARANVADDGGVTPLALACTNGSAAMVRRLLDAKADPNQARPGGETPLMLAARTGNAEVVKLLLAHGARVDAREPSRGQTALMWAIAENHPEAVRVLLENGADPHERSAAGFLPLLFAAQQGNLEIARDLLARGADVNAAGGDGSTALLVAVDSGVLKLFDPDEAAGRQHDSLIRFLIEHGADVNASQAGRTPLHSAVWTGQSALVDLLLARGADVNARLTKPLPNVGRTLGNPFNVSQVGATPFWLAAKFADVPLMKRLVQAGANPTLPSQDGTTPLMMAAGLDNAEGWDRYGRPWHGELTSLLDRFLEATTLALDLGGDVNALNRDGMTALHGAALVGSNDIVKLLVSKGARIDVPDKQGRTAWTIADGIFTGVFLTHRATADLLVELGANPDLGKDAPRTVGR
ncbi:MAG: ankyrin repeat domain-containing protein [Vicinamibacterales bacterium]